MSLCPRSPAGSSLPTPVTQRCLFPVGVFLLNFIFSSSGEAEALRVPGVSLAGMRPRSRGVPAHGGDSRWHCSPRNELRSCSPSRSYTASPTPIPASTHTTHTPTSVLPLPHSHSYIPLLRSHSNSHTSRSALGHRSLPALHSASPSWDNTNPHDFSHHQAGEFGILFLTYARAGCPGKSCAQ